MNQSQPALNINDIVKAFQTLVNPMAQKELIRAADQYITHCEAFPEFALLLMSIFTQAHNLQTKQQILIHLKNVIKRNWTVKRRTGSGCVMTAHIKEQIKVQLLQIYQQDWKTHHKEFNQIFRYLAREDFPLNYLQLNEFVAQVLSCLGGYELDHILESQELLPYLSLVKIVYKEYSKRRMLHSVDSFHKYCASTIQKSKTILGKISQALEIIRSEPQKVPPSMINRLLQCSRKIDKIVLYCLLSMVSSLQYNSDIIEVLRYEIAKIKGLLSLTSPDLRDQVQLNVLAILESTSKLQSYFPLLFAPFLAEYLQLIIELLFSQAFTNQKLIHCIINANIIPLSSFPYYMDKNQFKSSLEYKKDANEALHESSQELCHQIYENFYNSRSIGSLLEKIVGELMGKYPRQNEDDEIIFEDAEQAHEGYNEQSSFQLLVNFLKSVMKRFSQESKTFMEQVINHLITTPQQNPPSRVRMSMYQAVLMLPKTTTEAGQIKINLIFTLMQKCYRSQNFDIFCRFIRNYYPYFDKAETIESFKMLTLIIPCPTIKHHTVYQCSACIRKMLEDHEELAFPVENMGECIGRIFSLVEIYLTNPTHLWNLLNLLVQILKVLDSSTVLNNLAHINQCINILVNKKANDNMIVCALAQLLQNLLSLINCQDSTHLESKLTLYQISLKLVCSNSVQEEEELTQMSKHGLWLCVMRNINVHSCPEILKQQTLEMLEKLKENVISADPSVFCELLEQYALSGILNISSQNLISIYETMITEIQPDNEIRTIMSYFSLCYTHCLLTNDFNIKIAFICIQKLKELFGKVSPSINGLRMLLMLILSNYIITLGGETVFGSFSQLFPNYRDWFWPFVWSLEYISNKYSAKIVSMAILKSFNCLKEAFSIKIQQNLPFDHIIKFITLYTEPINLEQAMNSYLSSTKLFSHLEQIKSKNKLGNATKTHSRKVRLHVNANWCELDLSEPYRDNVLALFKQWDWDVDDLEERYTKSVIEKIVRLLQTANGNGLQPQSIQARNS